VLDGGVGEQKWRASLNTWGDNIASHKSSLGYCWTSTTEEPRAHETVDISVEDGQSDGTRLHLQLP
jgi:hypothetical protein